MAALLTIVGLGPGDPELITPAARRAIESADSLYLAGDPDPAIVDWLGDTHPFETLGSGKAGGSAWWAPALQSATGEQSCVIAVPGSPVDLGPDLTAIHSESASVGIQTNEVSGVSVIESIRRHGLDESGGEMAIVSADSIAAGHYPQFPPSRQTLIIGVRPEHAAQLQAVLRAQYPAEHRVLFLGPGKAIESAKPIPLEQLADRVTGTSTHLLLPAMGSVTAFEHLQEVVAHLRSPTGCPWDREQTAESLRQHLLEETYEVLDAIDSDRPEALQEELGDLLLQLVMQAQIAGEQGLFTMPDVVGGINDKLIRRHPHVFADVDVADVDEVLHNWESLKAEERRQAGRAASALDGVPAQLPALARAHELQARAARLGFDWPDVDGVLDKIGEEASELGQAKAPEAVADEFGDLLFAMVNLGRWLNVDPESALRLANMKFAARFARMESAVAEQGRSLSSMDLERLEALWDAAKRDLD